MGIEEVILRIAGRAKKLSIDTSLYNAISPTGEGISLKEKESTLLRYLEQHPQNKYYVFGLGYFFAWERIQNPLKTRYNGLITSFIKYLSPSPSLNLILLRMIGVRVAEPPEEIPEEEKLLLLLKTFKGAKELKTGIATNCEFDYFFPQLITIGYKTLIGSEATLATHLNQQEYWLIGSIEIGNHALIGAKSFIAPGVKIGDYSLVKAGSYVLDDVPSGITVSGNPAKRDGFRLLCSPEPDNSGILRIIKKPMPHS